VKAIFITFLLALSGCSYHLGRIPSVESIVSVGEIQAISPDSELRPILARALGVGLARRAKVGNGPPVHLQLLETQVSPVGGKQFRLSVRLQLTMDGRVPSVAGGSQVFQGSADPTLHRKSQIAATRQLAGQLVEVALMDLLSTEVGD
jgi:hypothetical protein